MRVVLKNFHIVDEETDAFGGLLIEDGVIARILREGEEGGRAALVIDGALLAGGERGSFPVLAPAFADLHAHFRDPGFPEKENLESASLAAAAGGFGSVVCMANTMPAVDSLEKARSLKERSDALGLIDLYPAVSLTKGMEGKELSGIRGIPSLGEGGRFPLMLSEDGKDVADGDLFFAAMKEARRIGAPVSCHCDFGGSEAEAAKKAGEKRSVWSRIEENNAVERVIELGKKAGCHIHIAHASTKETVDAVRRAKAEIAKAPEGGNFRLTCEAMPHNLCLTEEDADRLGGESWGRVNPPLRAEEDRQALIRAARDGTVDAIATDHAPHSAADKENGAPGFSGFETAFAAAYTELVRGGASGDGGAISLSRLSALMSANPARLLGFGGGSPGGAVCGANCGANCGALSRGRLLPGYRADLAIIDTETSWIVDPRAFKTKGKNSPFSGRRLYGKILMTLHRGRAVFQI